MPEMLLGILIIGNTATYFAEMFSANYDAGIVAGTNAFSAFLILLRIILR